MKLFVVNSNTYDPSGRCDAINKLGDELGVYLPSVTEHTCSYIYLPDESTDKQIEFVRKFLKQRGHDLGNEV